jgi:hypothetical protein
MKGFKISFLNTQVFLEYQRKASMLKIFIDCFLADKKWIGFIWNDFKFNRFALSSIIITWSGKLLKDLPTLKISRHQLSPLKKD